ncbi:MAG: DUF835 domain-containing protein [Candidatus Poseidoniaceae archaeon]|jgi:hypothetical protein|nr:DUF835 domain-containing protein [Candidatus Poseidoniaceae archaeon]
MEEIQLGKACTLSMKDPVELLTWTDKISMQENYHVLLISRLPQRRLLEHVHLDKVEAYWMTTQEVSGSIQPSIDQIHDLVNSRLMAHSGVVVMEGIELLIDMHGVAAVQQLQMQLIDALNRRPWMILFALDTDILDSVQLKRWHREAPKWDFPEIEVNIIETEDGIIIEENNEEMSLSEDGGTALSFLTRLQREGFTQDILRRRILQWRRMGLDVSELEPALHKTDDDAYTLYSTVEAKIRRAVELDNRLDILLERGHISEVTKLRFRVRQLTGFDEVESRIDELI